MLHPANTLHVLNGQAMLYAFQKSRHLDPDVLVPFNEAMCYGKTCSELFTEEFVATRAEDHHVTTGQYSEITLQPLAPLFQDHFENIVLWFDADMFCQINLLTVLAWLDVKSYNGGIVFQLVDEKFNPIKRYPLRAKGYYELYLQVLIRRTMPESIDPDPLMKGVERYLHYLRPDSDFMMYIERHEDMPANDLVFALLSEFKEYGLGDTQVLELIRAHRNRPA